MTKDNDLKKKKISKVSPIITASYYSEEYFLATAQIRETQAESGNLPEIR